MKVSHNIFRIKPGLFNLLRKLSSENLIDWQLSVVDKGYADVS